MTHDIDERVPIGNQSDGILNAQARALMRRTVLIIDELERRVPSDGSSRERIACRLLAEAGDRLAEAIVRVDEAERIIDRATFADRENRARAGLAGLGDIALLDGRQ